MTYANRVASQHGWELPDILQEWVPASLLDKPPSRASKKYRKEWARLIDGIRAHEWDAVVFWMADRSARHTVYGGELVDACKAGGVRMVEIAGRVYDFMDPLDEAQYMRDVAEAQGEVAKMAKRIRAAKLELAESGQLHTGGMRAFGFTGSGKQQVSRDRALAEQDCINEALTRVVAGDSLRGIVTDWTTRGIVTANGSRWDNATLRRMLLSPRLVGDRIHHGKVYPGEGAAIVDRGLWEAAGAILTDPSRRTVAVGGTRRYLLTGLLDCGVCHARVRGDSRDGNKVYVCPARSDGGNRCVQRKTADVDELVTGWLFAAVESDQFQQTVQGLAKDNPTNRHRERLAQLRANIDALGRLAAQAAMAEAQGIKPKPGRSEADYDRMIAEAEIEADREWSALERLTGDRVATHIPRNLRAVWPDFSIDRQRAIVAAVFGRMGKRLELHYQGRGKNFDASAVRVVDA